MADFTPGPTHDLRTTRNASRHKRAQRGGKMDCRAETTLGRLRSGHSASTQHGLSPQHSVDASCKAPTHSCSRTADPRAMGVSRQETTLSAQPSAADVATATGSRRYVITVASHARPARRMAK